MAARKVPNAQDILAAAEAARQQAQDVAGAAFGTAVRLPPASAQLALQMPELIENLATAIERLNTAIDRLDRVLSLVDPLFVALDQLLPRIEALAELGDDVGRVVGRLPGMGTLSRLTGRGPDEASEPGQSKQRKPTAKKSPPRR